MRNLPRGTYLGFTWIEDSPCAMGEFEVVIGPESVSSRIATGAKVVEECAPLSVVRDLTTDEILERFDEGAEATDVVGVQIGDGVVLLLMADPDNLPGLTDQERTEFRETARVLVRGMPGEEVFGPSFLFTPDQVAAGLFRQALATIENESGQSMPKLANGGRSIEPPLS